MGNASRRPDQLVLILVLILGVFVAVLAAREAPASTGPSSKPADPLWVRYLEAGMDARDAAWLRHSDACRAAWDQGDFAVAEQEARLALEEARAFPPGDPRLEASSSLLDRSRVALGSPSPTEGLTLAPVTRD